MLLTGSSGLVFGFASGEGGGVPDRQPVYAELGAFVHVDDVAAAVVGALAGDLVNADRHVRMLLCGPGPFDTSVARRVLGWHPTRTWPGSPEPFCVLDPPSETTFRVHGTDS